MAADWIELTPRSLDIPAALQRLTDPNSGAIATFVGLTRAETNSSGSSLLSLDYEAYAEMAGKQMIDLARRAREKWPILQIILLHRTGNVPLGEPSVFIAVLTGHRGEAFDACRWLIDTLKSEVAIWKKEVWSDGLGTWK